MIITKEIEAEIKLFLNEYWKRYLQGDIDTWSSYVADDYKNIGTNQEEIWNSKKEILDYTMAVIDQMAGNAELRNKTVQVFSLDPYILAHELGDMYVKIDGDWAFYGKLRLSSILQRYNDSWQVIHQHGSFPDTKTEEGEAFATEKISKENRELKDAVKRRTIELENKTRELSVEASLERIRSRSMAMQSSKELQEVIQVVYNEFLFLKINVEHTGFIIDYKERDDMQIWLTDAYVSPFQITIPYFDSPHWNSFIEAKRNGERCFTNLLNFEEKNKFYADLFNLIPPLPDESKQTIFSKPGLAISTVLLENVGLYIENFSGIPYTDEENATLMRFGKVFQQSYTRFLDLKKSEAQAKEVQIELSLERIRSRVTAMQESLDLLDIVVAMRAEFVNLGHEAHYFWHMRWLQDTYSKAMTSGDGTRIGMVMTLPRHIHGDITQVAQWEKSDEAIHILAMDAETAVDYVHKMITLGDFERVDPQSPTLDDIRAIGGLTFVMARTAHGEIGFSLPGVVPDPSIDAMNTLVRFAGVFDLAYKRFEDLKTAEKDLIEIKLASKKAEEALLELKATQTQLIQQEKLASLGQLTAGIAHEIQNPLNFINNFSEINTELIDEMKEELTIGNWQSANEIASNIKENEQKINHHGKRADAIVKGMLQHSRSSSGTKEPTDINALADEYLRLAYHGLRAKDKSFNATMNTDFDDTIGMVNVIPQDIGRVILNLITNAFYAVSTKAADFNSTLLENSATADAVNEKQKLLSQTPSPLQPPYPLEGGDEFIPTVSLKTKRHVPLPGGRGSEESGRRESDAPNEFIEISVADNGPGIPKNALDKIFQPFFTTKPTGQGTGLGLSLSYDIVKAHGGELKVNTKEGQGSVFTIQLPIS